MLEADVTTIHAIHSACLLGPLRPHYSIQQLDAWMAGRTPEGYWRSTFSGETYLVATRADAVIGYASRQDDELLSLFVDPSWQHVGIGSMLFRACDAQERVNRIKATLGAIDFYRRFGFTAVGMGLLEKREVAIPHILMRRI